MCHVRMGSTGVRAPIWLPVIWDIGRDWLKYQVVLIVIIVWITWHARHMYIIVPLYLLLFLMFYSRSRRLYTLLHFLIFVTLHVVTHYWCTCILCIAYMLLYVDIITVYAQDSSMVMLPTAYPYVHVYPVITIQQ